MSNNPRFGLPEKKGMYGRGSFSKRTSENNYDEWYNFQETKDLNSIKYYKFRDFNPMNLHKRDDEEEGREDTAEFYAPRESLNYIKMLSQKQTTL